MARVLALAPDLMFASRIEATLTAAGHETTIVSTSLQAASAAAQSDLVIVDLHAEKLELDDLAPALSGKPTIGYYSHVDAEARQRGERAGFDLVVPRSRMAREMPVLVASLLER